MNEFITQCDKDCKKKKIKQKHDKIKIIVSFSVHLVYDII